MKPIPIITYGAEKRHLIKAIENYDYIALGGLVPYSREKPKLQKWLDFCFSAVMQKYKSTGAMPKIHLLGITTDWVLKRYPCFSSDSSSWVSCLRFGGGAAAGLKKIPRYKESSAAMSATIHVLRSEIRKYKKMEQEATNLWEKEGFTGMTKFNLPTTEKEDRFIASAKANGYSLEILETDNGKRGIIRAYKMKLSELSPNTWNPNKTSDRTNKAIGESLNSYGQILECVARLHPDNDGFQIIDGEHRFKTINTEKNPTISVNILFGYSEPEAKKLTIILNETRGSADKIELASLLSELSHELDMDELKLGLPYDQSELDELIGLSGVDWDNFGDDFTEEPEPVVDDEWVSITVKIPVESMDVVNQAKDLIGEHKQLHKDKAILWGMVLECLAAEYLAVPTAPQ